MSTQTTQQQARGHLLEATKEFDKCMKCGKCRNVCPVFKELGNEIFSARGKNKLAEKLANGELQITKRIKQAINECLNCKTCAANCPAGVKPEEVVLRMRWYITTQEGLGWFKTILFRELLWRKWPIVLGAKLVAVSQRLFFGIGPTNPVRYFFPLFGFAKRRNFPQLALQTGQSLFPEVIPARGEKKMRIGYFTGCAGNLIYPNVIRSVVEILTNYGYEVVIPKDQKCNGTPVLANGDYEGAKRLMRHNFNLFQQYELDAVVVACSSCGLALKKEIKQFVESDQLDAFCNKVFDIHEFIEDNISFAEGDLGELTHKVSWHDPCHLIRGQGIDSIPRKLLQKIPGIIFKEMKDAAVCCGSAGSYCITHYDTSIKINNHKVKNIQNTDVDYVATGCPTCIMHIQDNLLQHQSHEKMSFTVELLADSLRAAGKI